MGQSKSSYQYIFVPHIHFRGTHFVEHSWFVVYFEGIYIHCNQKSAEAKNLPDTERTVVCDYLLLNCTTFFAVVQFIDVFLLGNFLSGNDYRILMSF